MYSGEYFHVFFGGSILNAAEEKECLFLFFGKQSFQDSVELQVLIVKRHVDFYIHIQTRDHSLLLRYPKSSYFPILSPGVLL